MAQAWNDQNCKPHVREAAKEFRDRFGMMNIGGYRSGPDAQDHGLGLALDVMTFNGNPIAEHAIANWQRLSITYVIWNRRIWDQRNGLGWVPYKGASPHIDHVHISFSPNASAGGADNFAPDLSQNAGCLGWLFQIFGNNEQGTGNADLG